MFHAAAVIGDFNPREAFLASNPKLNRPALIAAEEAVLDGILDQRLNGERRRTTSMSGSTSQTIDSRSPNRSFSMYK